MRRKREEEVHVRREGGRGRGTEGGIYVERGGREEDY